MAKCGAMSLTIWGPKLFVVGKAKTRFNCWAGHTQWKSGPLRKRCRCNCCHILYQTDKAGREHDMLAISAGISWGWPIPVAARSKASFCCRSSWDCGLEPRREHGCLSLVECCVLSGRGLCVGPIPRPEEFYRV
jgi:hypothetical protein